MHCRWLFIFITSLLLKLVRHTPIQINSIYIKRGDSMLLYTVKPGDSINAIARKFKVPVATIIQDNGIENPNMLVVGQSLIIKSDSFTYTVKEFDTLGQIAQNNGISIETLLQANPNLVPPYKLRIGQVLYIEFPSKNRTKIRVNGYAYTNSNLEILENSMPYLTMLSIFSYRLNDDGSLIPMNDEPLIELAKKYSVAPIMVVTNTKATGSFNTDLASSILNSKTKQDKLIEDIIDTLKTKGYKGINIDFEYIYPKDKEEYIQFIKELVNRVKESGKYLVSVALAPKYRANQEGLLYESHDYPTLSNLVDYVVIMTYEWGYTYGPAMAVAPINLVEKVINYAKSEMKSSKIFMGIPNYGYDFKLPYEKGVPAKSITNAESVNYAFDHHAAIEYEKKSETPFFEYYDTDKKEHIVYFEDPRSIQAKSLLAKDNELGGLSIWTISSYWQQLYEVIINYFAVEKMNLK